MGTVITKYKVTSWAVLPVLAATDVIADPVGVALISAIVPIKLGLLIVPSCAIPPPVKPAESTPVDAVHPKSLFVATVTVIG